VDEFSGRYDGRPQDTIDRMDHMVRTAVRKRLRSRDLLAWELALLDRASIQTMSVPKSAYSVTSWGADPRSSCCAINQSRSSR
jgi:hypothetical protein